MIASKAGAPRPTDKPITLFFSLESLEPILETNVDSGITFDVEVDCDVEEGGGIYDTGLPVVADIDLILEPKETVVTALCVEAGKTASDPSGTEVTRVRVVVFFDVDWRDTGQLRSPEEIQAT